MCIATNEITAPHAPFSLHAMTLPFVSDEETAGIPNLASSFGSNLSRQLDEHLLEGSIGHTPIQNRLAGFGVLHGRKHLTERDFVGRQLKLLGAAQGVGAAGAGGHAGHQRLYRRQLLLPRWHRHREHEVAPIASGDLLGCPNADEAAIHEDAQPVAQHLRLLHAVRRQHDAAPLPRLLHHVPQVAPRRWVQPSGRLIQEHDGGAAHKADGDGEAALHAAAELAHQLLAHAPQVHCPQPRLHGCSQLRTLEVLQAAVEIQVLHGGELLPQQVVLRAHPQHGVDAAHVLPDAEALDGCVT
mmetsp:Transcript_5729/g.16380  ORF Transcript_5729/g.16380 Transcript_5729/m.16380 type:complete len:299 (-) Transcript_5729:2518-3414(-)